MEPEPEPEPELTLHCPSCEQTFTGPNAAQALGSHKKVHNPKPKPGRKRGRPARVTTETLLDQVFPNGIPVQHLPAVAAWADTTTDFLKAIGRKP